MSAGPITIFADFSCPFCYVTEAGLWAVARDAGMELQPRALELYPAPVPLPSPADEPDWEQLIQPTAAELGLAIRAPSFRPRTRKAHEAARMAAGGEAGTNLRRAIYAAYWSEGRDISRIDVLAEIAGGCGLDPVAVKIALDIDQHRDEVIRDEELARRLNISRAPTLFVGTGTGARVLVGLQEPSMLRAALLEPR